MPNRVGEAMEHMAKVESLMGANLESAHRRKTGHEERLLCSIKTTICGKRHEAVEEEERLQSNKDVTVQRIGFCELTTTKVHAVSRRVPSERRG